MAKKTAKRRVQASDKRKWPEPAIRLEPDDDPCGIDGLKDRQRVFVLAYLGPAGMNATRAAAMAGYRDDNRESLAVTACRVLNSPAVQRAIEREIGKRFGTADDVRAAVTAIANGNAADYLRRGEDGKLHLDLEAMAEAGALGLLHQVQEERIEAGSYIKTTKMKLRMYDRLRALELLAKMNGQLVERRDITSGGKTLKAYADIDDGDAPGN